MRVLKLTGLRRMQLLDAPQPALTNPTDVLIRVACVGVCGSDVHYYTTGRIGSQVVQYPFAVGHEFAGTIADGPRAGERVVADPGCDCRRADRQATGEKLYRCNRFLFHE